MSSSELTQCYNSSPMFLALLAIAILKWKTESLRTSPEPCDVHRKKQPETSKQPPGDRTLGAAQKYLPRPGFNSQQGCREFMNLTALLMWGDYQQQPLESTSWTSDHNVTRFSVEHLWLQDPVGFSHSSMMLPKSHFPPKVTYSV